MFDFDLDVMLYKVEMVDFIDIVNSDPHTISYQKRNFGGVWLE